MTSEKLLAILKTLPSVNSKDYGFVITYDTILKKLEYEYGISTRERLDSMLNDLEQLNLVENIKNYDLINCVKIK